MSTSRSGFRRRGDLSSSREDSENGASQRSVRQAAALRSQSGFDKYLSYDDDEDDGDWDPPPVSSLGESDKSSTSSCSSPTERSPDFYKTIALVAVDTASTAPLTPVTPVDDAGRVFGSGDEGSFQSLRRLDNLDKERRDETEIAAALSTPSHSFRQHERLRRRRSRRRMTGPASPSTKPLFANPRRFGRMGNVTASARARFHGDWSDPRTGTPPPPPPPPLSQASPKGSKASPLGSESTQQRPPQPPPRTDFIKRGFADFLCSPTTGGTSSPNRREIKATHSSQRQTHLPHRRMDPPAPPHATKPLAFSDVCLFCGICNCACMSKNTHSASAANAIIPSKNMLYPPVEASRRLMEMEIERVRIGVEKTINDLLGSSSLTAHSFLATVKAWFASEKSEVTSDRGASKDSNVRKVLFKNRIAVLKAQERKIRRLRSEMHFLRQHDSNSAGTVERPFSPSVSRARSCPRGTPVPRIVRNYSMDQGENRRMEILEKVESRPQRIEKSEEDETDWPMMGTMLCSAYGAHPDSPLTLTKTVEEPPSPDDLCYDSDPEVLRLVRPRCAEASYTRGDSHPVRSRGTAMMTPPRRARSLLDASFDDRAKGINKNPSSRESSHWQSRQDDSPRAGLKHPTSRDDQSVGSVSTSSLSPEGYRTPRDSPETNLRRRGTVQDGYDSTPTLPSSPPHSPPDLTDNDEAAVIDFLQELTTTNISLVWHPTGKQNRGKASPIRVEAWFEMGSRLKAKVIQPKFVWRASYQPDLERLRKLDLSCRAPHAVELLNIVRVLKPDTIDRDSHPFAKRQNSFSLLSSNNEIFLFEAADGAMRDRFVHGMKLAVARLASKIIVGDQDVLDEFFTPWGPSPFLREMVSAHTMNVSEPCDEVSTSDDGASPNKNEVKPKKSKSCLSRKPQRCCNGKMSQATEFVTATVNAEAQRTDELWGTRAWR